MCPQMNQQIADYFKNQPVVRVWLFGSFARGEETPLSDVDLLSNGRFRNNGKYLRNMFMRRLREKQ